MEDWLNSLFYLINYTIENCLLPGQIENWNIICDVGNISLMTIPSELRSVLSQLQSHFRCRLYKMFIINASTFLSVLWNIIKTFLDGSTERKIKIIGKGSEPFNEFKHIRKCQIEKKFGGVANDTEKHFFPPNFPSNEYFIENDEASNILVNEQTYIEEFSKRKGNLKKNPYVNKDNPNEDSSNDKKKNGEVKLIENLEKSVYEEMSLYEEAKSKDVSRFDNISRYEDIDVNNGNNYIIEKLETNYNKPEELLKEIYPNNKNP